MPYCPIWKWYVYPRDKNGIAVKSDYVINSAITGSIKVKETNGVSRATIATDNLKERGMYLQCAVNNDVKEILYKEAEGQKGEVQHYGLIIIRPGKEKLSESEVVDFISFHRHPTNQTAEPTPSRYDISEYNTVFEELVLEQAQPSTRPPVEAGV